MFSFIIAILILILILTLISRVLLINFLCLILGLISIIVAIIYVVSKISEPIVCKECGTHIDKNTNQCPKCGNPLEVKKINIEEINVLALIGMLSNAFGCLIIYLTDRYSLYQYISAILIIYSIIVFIMSPKDKKNRTFAIIGIIIDSILILPLIRYLLWF